MNSETQLIVELWEMMRDSLPASRRLDAAIQMLKAFEEYGFDPADLHDLEDEDKHLRRAYNDLYAEEMEQEDHDGEDEE